MVVQARTLEFYDQFGFADEVVRAGIPGANVHWREGGPGGHEIRSVSFKDLGEGLSPFPFPLNYPQDDHERFLVDKLRESGVNVEWGSRLAGFEQLPRGIIAAIAYEGRTEHAEFAYLGGCDGAHSAVRETLGIGFQGGTYEQLFYVADVKINRGFDQDLYFNIGEHILTLMFPVRSSGMQRLIGLVPPELSTRDDLKFEDIRAQQEQLLDVKVTEVNWFSAYRVHHRVAEHFRAGRAFLLGDAAHIHSPVGGQGMNTGIGDAINLGWKLAQVLQGRAADSLLDTYEPERMGFAQTLVATTDRAFTPIVAEGLKGEITRKILGPLFVTAATRFALGRHAMFRLVSQTRIHYADSPLSEGRAGEVLGGDRLPWFRMDGTSNFAPLRSLDWQVHVYGKIHDALVAACREMSLAVHEFLWTDAAADCGLQRDAMYLIRPDGHVALAASLQSAEIVKNFADRFGLRFTNLP